MAGKKKKKQDNTKYVTISGISRDGNKFKATHSATKAHKKKIDYSYIEWKLDGSKGSDIVIDHKKETKNKKEDSITINRDNYNPGKNGSCKYGNLKHVYVRSAGCVKTKNKKGKTVYKRRGQFTDLQHYDLDVPYSPSIETDVDPDKGEVYFRIKSSNHDGKKERRNTSYVITVSGKMTDSKDGSSSAEEFNTETIDASNYKNLRQGEYIKINCTATAHGLGGDNKETAYHIFAHPKPPEITEAKLEGDKITGTVYVTFKLNNDKEHVDTVQLHRLQSEVTTKEEAANSNDWRPVDGAVEDAQVAGLQDPSYAATPVPEGTHVWYRIEAKKDNLSTVSEPFECKALYVTKSTTSAGTVDVVVTDAGDGWVKLHVTDSEKDDDCVRVSWSDYEKAWTSSQQPDSFDVTWLDKGQADVYVRGLENGKRYWFAGQAVDTDADGKEVLGGLSKISDATSAIPSSDAGTVSVTVPMNVGVVSDLPVSWAFSSDMAQQSAEVLVGDKVAASVVGAGTEASVPAALLEPYIGAGAEIHVRVHAGGVTFVSEKYTVIVADTPSCSISTGTLTATPMRFTVTTDSSNSPSVEAYIISEGHAGSGFDGDAPQYAGDCIWSGSFASPQWTGEGPYACELEVILDEDMVFWDTATYTVYASLHDPVTQLDSAEAHAAFRVDWAHQADMPTGTVEVDADELTATVTVNAPVADDDGDGYQPGDRFDLYRVTMDGEKRIARNLPFGSSVTDRFAPFGREADLHYMAVTRTVDGDYSNSEDIEYELPGAALRFDWGDESLELPYNIEDTAGYEKGYEEDTALDGSIVGWWDGSSRRKSSLKTSLIKLQSADEEEAIASIARYAGPVFVRTPAGAAFPANVIPTDISRSYMTREISVSLQCDEVALSAEHMPNPKIDVMLPAWRGGAVYALGGVVFDATGNFPMDDWTFLGYNGQTLYVIDGSTGNDADSDVEDMEIIRDGSGVEKTGWSWDGSVLLDANGNEVALTQEAS